MEDRDYSVSEAVRLIGVESHVLRYWEEELQLQIRRNTQGHRIYSTQDIGMLRRVRDLREKGLQLKAIRLLTDGWEEVEYQTFQGQDVGAEDKLFGSGEMSRDVGGDEEQLICEIIPAPGQKDELYLFERILRRLMEEVVSEQNEKLEAAIAGRVQEELENFYAQYAQAVREAAASRETEGVRGGKIRRALRRLFGTDC